MNIKLKRLIALSLFVSLVGDPRGVNAVVHFKAQPVTAVHSQDFFLIQTLSVLSGFSPRSEDDLNTSATLRATRDRPTVRLQAHTLRPAPILGMVAAVLAAFLGMPFPLASIIDSDDRHDSSSGELDEVAPSEQWMKWTLAMLNHLPELIHDLSNNIAAIRGFITWIKTDQGQHPLSPEIEQELTQIDTLVMALLGEIKLLQTQPDDSRRIRLASNLVQTFSQKLAVVRAHIDHIRSSRQVRHEHMLNLRKGIGLAEDTFLASQGRMHKRSINLNALVQDVVAQAKATIQSRNTIFIDQPDERLMVWADRGLLGEALLNLLTNALHATSGVPEGWVRVRIRESESDSEGVRLAVSDNGYGIKPALLPPRQPNILNRFFSTKGDQGTGLGLHVVDKIIQRHGGTLDIQSEGEGTGSTFTIELPSRKFYRQVQPSDPAVGLVARPRILLVEDDSSLRSMIQMYFSMKGFEVVEEADGMPAIENFTPGKYIAAFIDGNMPMLNGIAVVRHIQSVEPGLPIIFTSDYSQSNAEMEEEFPASRFPHIELSRSKTPEDLDVRLQRLIQWRTEAYPAPKKASADPALLMMRSTEEIFRRRYDAAHPFVPLLPARFAEWPLSVQLQAAWFAAGYEASLFLRLVRRPGLLLKLHASFDQVDQLSESLRPLLPLKKDTDLRDLADLLLNGDLSEKALYQILLQEVSENMLVGDLEMGRYVFESLRTVVGQARWKNYFSQYQRITGLGLIYLGMALGTAGPAIIGGSSMRQADVALGQVLAGIVIVALGSTIGLLLGNVLAHGLYNTIAVLLHGAPLITNLRERVSTPPSPPFVLLRAA